MKKVSQDYGDGSKGSDFLNTQDGSETLQNSINTNEPSNGDGQGWIYDPARANHPFMPDGEAPQVEDQGGAGSSKSGPAVQYKGQPPLNQGPGDTPMRSNDFSDFPFGEQMIDDNHADGNPLHFANYIATKEKLMKKEATPGFFFFTGIR